jgi:hypothetical protein
MKPSRNLSEVGRLERMLDASLTLQELYKASWEQERALKWKLADLLLKAATSRDNPYPSRERRK